MMLLFEFIQTIVFRLYWQPFKILAAIFTEAISINYTFDSIIVRSNVIHDL